MALYTSDSEVQIEKLYNLIEEFVFYIGYRINGQITSGWQGIQFTCGWQGSTKSLLEKVTVQKFYHLRLYFCGKVVEIYYLKYSPMIDQILKPLENGEDSHCHKVEALP